MKKLLAVDSNSILNRAFYGIRPLTTSTGLFTNAVYGFANILHKHIGSLSPDAIVAAFDMKAPTFRHREFEGYKATRKPMPGELSMQLPYAKKCAELMGARVVTLEGWEADDILGTLSGLADRSGGEWSVWILTGDRDSLQLIGENTTVLLATNTETVNFDRDKFIETYGVAPERYVDVKALMGDSSDNIPGVAGIGEKTAFKLIGEFSSLDGVYENLGPPSIAKGVRAKLEAGRESAYLSQKLARIDREAPLGFELDELPTAETDREGLRGLFRELEFSGLAKRFGLEDEAASEEQAERKKLAPVELERLLSENSGSKCALALEEGKLSISFDGKTIVEPEGVSSGEILERLETNRLETIVYDSKRLYHELENAGIVKKSTFDRDVMLEAYVLDPADGQDSAVQLMAKYIGSGAAGDRLPNAAEVWRLDEEMEKLLCERGQEKLLTDIEIPLARVLADMEKIGFKVDLEGLGKFSNELSEQADQLRERIYCEAGMEFNINSPKQLGEVLFERLGLPSGKKTQRGYSTSAEVLERLAPFAPIVSDILDYRQLTKLKSTYGDGLAKAADENGVIHTSFNQTVTVTGRLSSTEPNLQNIPVRTELGREMRRFFIPSAPGRVLIDADYSQIELRILAHISGDETMLDAFRNGIDIHAVTASQAFGVPLEAVTSEMRKRAKAVNFGIVYGISDFSLAQDIGVSRKQAAEYISSYLAKYPKVDEYLHEVVRKAREDGYVTTMFGRRRYIPELTSSKKTLQSFGERVAMNSPIQGTAADIIKLSMINVDRALRESGLDAKLILQVHDELIVEADKKDAEKARDLLVREMESAVKLDLPLTVSAAIGDSWYDCKD